MRYILVVFILAAFISLAIGSEKSAMPEHPVIRPYPGSVLAKNMSKHYSFASYDFIVLNPAIGRDTKKM